jgi:hypothetical protein
VAYRDELASLLDALETKAHDSDQVDRWVAWLSAAGYSDEEAYDVVYGAVAKRRGAEEAERFANTGRRRFMWGWDAPKA